VRLLKIERVPRSIYIVIKLIVPGQGIENPQAWLRHHEITCPD
jgi:hypothetical protein